MKILQSWKTALLVGTVFILPGCGTPATESPSQAPVSLQSRVPVDHPASSQRQGASTDAGAVPISGTGAATPVSLDTGSRQAVPTGQDNSNLLLGNPSRAGRDPNNYLVERPQHALAYNKANGGPNWVSWHLQKSDLGNVRRGDFWPDPLLSPDMQIRPNDYRGSGYDRGHVCPSGDRTRSKEDNTATFVMSNMLPQAAALNRQVWKDLEDYGRYLVNGGNELYIVAGGAGSAERIGDGKVNVPTVCWKIIVVLPLGDHDLQRINDNTRIIAVSMPNREQDEIAHSKWSQWITTVAQLEKTTGYDFLSALPDNVEQALEQKRDSGRAAATRRAGNDTSPNDDSRVQRRSTEAAPRAVSAHPILGEGRQAAHHASDQAATGTQVWVNADSGVYHFPGARWYGNTKQGAYMSEREAMAQGYHAAQNGQ